MTGALVVLFSRVPELLPKIITAKYFLTKLLDNSPKTIL